VLRVRETAFWNVADVLAPITGLAYVLAVVAP
jgi:hypothetical protein